MKHAVTVSYEQLLCDYLEHPSEDYEKEYPEFRSFRKWLTRKEMNSCRWNKEKMIEKCQDKRQLQEIFRSIYRKGWISSNELKGILAEEFEKRGMKSMKPVATLIEQCQLYFVEKKAKKIDGKLTRGYELGNFKFTLL